MGVIELKLHPINKVIGYTLSAELFKQFIHVKNVESNFRPTEARLNEIGKKCEELTLSYTDSQLSEFTEAKD